ncbi:hypothetical protein GLW20_02310 [Virgibacillus halodenitrificans]|nr:hypothetical protein [Virgibacillus halodenitrificans]
MITMEDKYRFEDFGFDCEPGNEDPITPEFEHKTLKIPKRPGLWNFGSEIKEKVFGYNLKIMDRFYEDRQRRFNELVAFLFDAYGQPRDIKVVRDYESDKHYIAKLNQSLNPTWDEEEGSLSIVFIAEDPYKYALANQYDPVDDIMYGEVTDNDYYANPQSFDWIYSKHYSAINNYSSIVTDFMIEIEGTVNNPQITNLINNKTLTLPSINNGKLEVNGKRFVVFKNGQDILTGFNYNFFDIQPGEVGFLFEGGNPNAKVTYKWLHKYM